MINTYITKNEDDKDIIVNAFVIKKVNVSVDITTLNTDILITGVDGEIAKDTKSSTDGIFDIMQDDYWVVKSKDLEGNYGVKKDIFEKTCKPYTELENKTMDITDTKGTKANISDVKIFGKDDLFQLVSKASSEKQGWMKSTKVCPTTDGFFMQVSTQQRNPDGSYSLAEALSFCPTGFVKKNIAILKGEDLK